MKATWVFFLFLTAGNSFSQETVSWIRTIDSASFEVFHHKKHLPKAFYKIQGIENGKQLANQEDDYSPSCVGKIRGQLNWVAKRDENWVVCITRGGSAVITKIYFLDYDTGKLRAYSSTARVKHAITFGELSGLLQSGNLGLEELNSAD